jgi:teichuronic acid biosynthesis glycosyltransferase TuaH
LTAARPEPAAGDPYLVWMAAVSWDGIRGTDRHLATAMTRHARILWVDPPVSLLTSADRRGTVGRRVRPRLSVIGDRITRLTPMGLPGLTRPAIRATTAVLARAQVRWAVRQLGIRPFAVVATHLEDVLGRLGPGVVDVLYGTDDYVAGAQLMGLSAARLRRQEQRAVARADLAAVVSPQLADRWAGLGASPVVIPNGCSLPEPGPAAALADLTDAADLAAIRSLPRPVAGLVGQLSERIDLDLLDTIVSAGLSLVIVGPRNPRWEQRRFEELIARRHVHFTGQVAAEAVPSYLATIDIGITPYRDTPFNRASFPLKTLEYLGAGRPVVSTDLPAARWLREDLGRCEQAAVGDQILARASDRAHFADAVHRLAGGGPLMADYCRAFAARHTWPRRADAMAALIGLPAAACQRGSQAPPGP